MCTIVKGVNTHAMAVSQGPLEQTPPSVLAALAHGFEQRNVECSKPTHKIRVDFKVSQLSLCIPKFRSCVVPMAFMFIINKTQIELKV